MVAARVVEGILSGEREAIAVQRRSLALLGNEFAMEGIFRRFLVHKHLPLLYQPQVGERCAWIYRMSYCATYRCLKLVWARLRRASVMEYDRVRNTHGKRIGSEGRRRSLKCTESGLKR